MNAENKRPRKTQHSDVLIIGGGISGLTAALTIKEIDPAAAVLLVDKACASKGWAGKAARTAGLLSFVSQEKDPEEFARYCAGPDIGCGLNDMALLRDFAYNSRRLTEHLADWDVDIERNEDGSMAVGVWPLPWVTAGVDPDMCRKMSSRAKQYGVRFEDHVVISELIVQEGSVKGAVGFHLLEGTYQVFPADVVILACGSQNFDITPSWCSTGVSQKLAYDAGCRFRNVEFCGMGDFGRIGQGGQRYYGQHSGAHTAHDCLYVGEENISQKWRPGFHSSMDPMAAYAWYRETMAGNGPVEVHYQKFRDESGELFHFHPNAMRRMHRVESLAEYPYDHEQYEVFPGFISEMSAIRVGHGMETDIPGLLAIGDTSGAGSARAGAVPAPPAKIHGTGILNALYSGDKGGNTAVLLLHGMKRPYGQAYETCGRLPEELLDRLEESTYHFLDRPEGISPRDVIHRVQDAMTPCDYSFVKTKERMEEALGIILEAKEMLPRMKAENLHELSKCLDAQAMVLCGEMFYRASLARTESRSFHLREDYPETDASWQKWLNIRKNGEKMEIFTEEIPNI